MATLGSLMCCGVKEIALLSTHYSPALKGAADERGRKVLADILTQYYKYYASFQTVNGKRTWVVADAPRLYLPCGLFIFTEAHQGVYYARAEDAKTFRYGWRFAKYLRKNNLGDIVCTKQSPNRNYILPPGTPGNVYEVNGQPSYENKTNAPHMITAYLWTPDLAALEAWCAANLPKPTPQQKPY